MRASALRRAKRSSDTMTVKLRSISCTGLSTVPDLRRSKRKADGQLQPGARGVKQAEKCIRIPIFFADHRAFDKLEGGGNGCGLCLAARSSGRVINEFVVKECCGNGLLR